MPLNRFENYPVAVPRDIDEPSEHIIELLERSAKHFPKRDAFYSFGSTLPYADLEEQSSALARWLYTSTDLQEGDRVALMMPNLFQYPLAFFAILKAGMIATSINPLYSGRELDHQLKDSGAKAIVIFDHGLPTLAEAIAGTSIKYIIVTSVGDLLNQPKRLILNTVLRLKRLKQWRRWRKTSFPQASVYRFNEVLLQGNNITCKLPALNIADPAVLQYTGGTTGLAKGAVLTHRNLVSNLLQMETFFPILKKIPGVTVLTALPMYHIFSLTVNCLLFVKLGGCNVLIPDARRMNDTVRALRRRPCHIITGVNTLFVGLLNCPQFRRLNFATLRLTIGGGMPVYHQTAIDWQKLTGDIILQGYGLTETSPVVCVNPSTEVAFNNTVGLPLPSTQVSIRDADDKELSIGEHGELWVKGPQVMQGYWNKREETRFAMDADGWLKTGDMAFVDDGGYIHIVGRKKNLILVSGFNVYPSEIEDVLTEHPDIREAACIGIEDPSSGQRVKAYVVKAAKTDPTAEELIAFCRDKLVDYKVPKQIVFRDSLPKSNTGKILHRLLTD